MVTMTSVDVLFRLVLLPVIWSQASGLDCFECFSFNKSDPSCGDPFHPAYGQYSRDCQQGKQGRVGGFPAKFCIKLIGNTANDDTEMVYRGCSLESLDSQCGDFKYEEVRYSGCIMSCAQNGCNSTSGVRVDMVTLTFGLILTLVKIKWH